MMIVKWVVDHLARIVVYWPEKILVLGVVEVL